MDRESQLGQPALPDVQSGDVWFYVRDDDVHGPVSFKRLLELSARRQLGPLVWQPHYDDWRPVASVPGLTNVRDLGEAVRLPPLTPAEKFPMLVLLAFSIGMSLMYILGYAPVASEELAARVADTFSLEVCHDGREGTAFVAIGYQQDGAWQARGWYPVAPGECQVLMRGVSGPVFAFAESRQGGRTWMREGKLRSFCVDPDKAFALATTACDDPDTEHQHQAFGSLDLEAAGGRAVWRLQEVGAEDE